MVVADLTVVERQRQESPRPAWPDDDDGAGLKKSIPSAPKECLSGQYVTLLCRAVIDGVNRQAGDAQRGRCLRR